MSEAQDKKAEALHLAATALHDHETFLNSKTWRELNADAQETVDALQKDLLLPMTSMEDALRKNFVIGRLHGMLAMGTNAETKLGMLKDAHDKLVKENTDG